ncbi:low molecular weight phosphatase family protein [Arthrobacter sp. GCM10027362]
MEPTEAETADPRSRTPFRILMVCTGNVCRSPVAEQVLRAWLDELSPDTFEIRSAGTRALTGSAMTRLAVRQLAAITEPGTFTARQLTADLLPAQDLVLGMTRGHRSEIVQLHPGVLRRTFTLREFGRMVQHLNSTAGCRELFEGETATRWRRLVSSAPAVRPETLADGEQDDDIVDPYHRPADAYAQMLSEMLPALQALRAFEASFRN